GGTERRRGGGAEGRRGGGTDTKNGRVSRGGARDRGWAFNGAGKSAHPPSEAQVDARADAEGGRLVGVVEGAAGVGIAPLVAGEEAGAGPLVDRIGDDQAGGDGQVVAVDGNRSGEAGFLVVRVVGVGHAGVGADDPLALEDVVGGVEGKDELVVAVIAVGCEREKHAVGGGLGEGAGDAAG